MSDYFRTATDITRHFASSPYPEADALGQVQTASTPCLDGSTERCVPPAADDPIRVFWAQQGVAIVERCVFCHRELKPGEGVKPMPLERLTGATFPWDGLK